MTRREANDMLCFSMVYFTLILRFVHASHLPLRVMAASSSGSNHGLPPRLLECT